MKQNQAKQNVARFENDSAFKSNLVSFKLSSVELAIDMAVSWLPWKFACLLICLWIKFRSESYLLIHDVQPSGKRPSHTQRTGNCFECPLNVNWFNLIKWAQNTSGFYPIFQWSVGSMLMWWNDFILVVSFSPARVTPSNHYSSHFVWKYFKSN